MAASDVRHKYLEAQVRTASKEQLLLMLFDGAIRFANQAKDALARTDYDTSYAKLTRAQKISLELICAMDEKIGEPIYSNLCGLYKFVYFRLLQANLRRESEPIDEALKILHSLRETWSMAAEMRQKELGDPEPAMATGTDGRPASINIEG